MGPTARGPRGWARRAALVCGLVAAAALALRAPGRPSNDRHWSPDHAVLPTIRVSENLVHVRNVRNFRYDPSGRAIPGYYDATYDLDRIESVWFVLTPFSESWRGPAHAFVSFGFADSQFVAVSVEARKEVGEAYGIVAGLLRRFELIYVVGDERDLIGRRALHDGDSVYVYPITAPPEKARRLFLEMLGRADRLARHPEYYNTLTNNCTSNLVRHVNLVAPGTIPHGLKTILPGYADEVALGLGLIEGPAGVDEARARYGVNDRARRAGDSRRFSFLIRSDAGGAGGAGPAGAR